MTMKQKAHTALASVVLASTFLLLAATLLHGTDFEASEAGLDNPKRKVDLDVDANYDNEISIPAPDDPIEEDHGGIVVVGERDDIIIRLVPDSEVVTNKLEWTSNKIKVFEAGTEVTSPYICLPPKTLSVRGEIVSDRPRDVSMTLTSIPPGGVDAITYTVVKVDSVEHDIPHCWDGSQTESKITFTAVPAPSGASFPSGCPTWTATVGSFVGGNTGSTVVWQAPTGSGGNATITATCGSSVGDVVMYVHLDHSNGGDVPLVRQDYEAFSFTVQPPDAPVTISATVPTGVPVTPSGTVPPSTGVPVAPFEVSVNELSVQVNNVLDDVYAWLDDSWSVDFEASLPAVEQIIPFTKDWTLKKWFREHWDNWEKPRFEDTWDLAADLILDAAEDGIKDGYLGKGFPAPLAGGVAGLGRSKIETWLNSRSPFPATVTDSLIDESVTFDWNVAAQVGFNFGLDLTYTEENFPGWPDVSPNWENFFIYSVDYGFTGDYEVGVTGPSVGFNASSSGENWILTGAIAIKTGNSWAVYEPTGWIYIQIKFE